MSPTTRPPRRRRRRRIRINRRGGSYWRSGCSKHKHATHIGRQAAPSGGQRRDCRGPGLALVVRALALSRFGAPHRVLRQRPGVRLVDSGNVAGDGRDPDRVASGVDTTGVRTGRGRSKLIVTSTDRTVQRIMSSVAASRSPSELPGDLATASGRLLQDAGVGVCLRESDPKRRRRWSEFDSSSADLQVRRVAGLKRPARHRCERTPQGLSEEAGTGRRARSSAPPA